MFIVRDGDQTFDFNTRDNYVTFLKVMKVGYDKDNSFDETPYVNEFAKKLSSNEFYDGTHSCFNELNFILDDFDLGG